MLFLDLIQVGLRFFALYTRTSLVGRCMVYGCIINVPGKFDESLVKNCPSGKPLSRKPGAVFVCV